MTKTPWQTHIDPIRLAVDARIDDLIAGWQGHPLLLEAMAYAVRAGGKRMRPILASATCQAFGGRASDALDLGCAVELIHAYSLVHDDLPSMDNDLLRRGLPTVHVKYGEAMGILVGEALQAAACERAGAASAPADPTRKLRAVLALADASGAAGMVATARTCGGRLARLKAPRADDRGGQFVGLPLEAGIGRTEQADGVAGFQPRRAQHRRPRLRQGGRQAGPARPAQSGGGAGQQLAAGHRHHGGYGLR